MIKLITPRQSETVITLRKEHAEYINNPHDFEAEYDLSSPLPAVFTYEPCVDGDITLTDSSGHERHVRASQGRAEVYNLLIGEKYTWQVKIGSMRSEERVFYTDGETPRLLFVEGVSNVRDFGGYRTSDGGRIRQGMIYRSAEMNGHTPVCEAGLLTLTNELCVRTDIDLRGATGGPYGTPFDRTHIRYVNFPVLAYAEIFDEGQMELYRNAFELLADGTTYPAIVHCRDGMDRTGTMLFILGALLGADEGDLLLDYEISSFSARGPRSRHSEDFSAFFEKFHTYGKSARTAAENFLHECGVSDGTLTRIRELLLEK